MPLITGASVKESMLIHEWNLPSVNREWLWTSISRCVEFRKVRFFKNDDFAKQLNKHMIMIYFNNTFEIF